MNFVESIPFIVGFIMRGESGLLMCLLYYANHPEYWFLICGFAVIASNVSFLCYYSLGFYADRFNSLHKYVEILKKRIPAPSIHVPTPLVLLILRFLIGVRNPAAVFIGIKKYSVVQFTIYNFLGSIIWILSWFGVFYVLRSGTYNALVQYGNVIYTAYGALLIVWIAGSFLLNAFKEKPS